VYEGGYAVVLGHLPVPLHRVEELGHVLDARLRLRVGLPREAGEEARGLEEAVEQLARAPPGQVLGRGVEAGEEPLDTLARLPAHAGELVVRGQATHDLHERPRLARGV